MKLLVVALSAVAVSSCGILKFEKSSDVQPNRYSGLDGIMLATMEDPDCSASIKLNSMTAWLWNGTETVSTLVDFKGTPGVKSGLASNGVSRSLHSHRSEKNCKSTGKSSAECSKSTTLQVEQTVKICNQNGVYGRDSIEGVTLTSQYIVGKARSFYESLPNYKPMLPQALVAIQPQFIKNITKTNGQVEQVVESDNASYASLKDTKLNEGLFIVYPTSKNEFGISRLHLWEVPFVMSHEYGHNIFNHHVGAAVESVGLTSLSSRGIDHMIRQNDKVVEDSNGSYLTLINSQKDRSDLAIDGLSELFADLFAFYANGEKADLLRGVRCLDQTRDPLSALTEDGTMKVWDLLATQIYEGDARPIETRLCSKPKFDDEHDVATVLGYSISKLTSSVMAGADSRARLNVLVKSLDQISNYIKASGGQVSLDGLMEQMVQTIVSQNLTSATLVKSCDDFAALVPGLPKTSAACR